MKYPHIEPGAKLIHRDRGACEVLTWPFHDDISGNYDTWVVIKPTNSCRQIVACALLEEPPQKYDVTMTVHGAGYPMAYVTVAARSHDQAVAKVLSYINLLNNGDES